MSRSGYTDDCDNLGLWRGAVQRATTGYRGQHLLRRLRDALDAMPVKRLITGTIKAASGDVCALGALDPNAPSSGLGEDAEELARHFGIARALAAEIVYMNDERFDGEWVAAEGPMRSQYYGRPASVWRPFTPEERWARMREWVNEQIIESPQVVDAVDPVDRGSHD